jgi:hypothetical protein
MHHCVLGIAASQRNVQELGVCSKKGSEQFMNGEMTTFSMPVKL